MTNNNDNLARLITSMETQVAMREPDIDRRVRFLADPENHQFIDNIDDFVKEIDRLKATLAGINLALGEARAIAEGY